jgi:hypothetical protein
MALYHIYCVLLFVLCMKFELLLFVSCMYFECILCLCKINFELFICVIYELGATFHSCIVCVFM